MVGNMTKQELDHLPRIRIRNGRRRQIHFRAIKMKKLKPTLPPNTPRPAFYWDKKLYKLARECREIILRNEKEELISE